MIIGDVKLYPLKKIEDERGAVLHMLRSDQEHFINFGEAYFSVINSGITKGWKLHREATQFLCAPVGEVEFIIFDPRVESSTHLNFQKVVIGISNYSLLVLPPNLWYCFTAISDGAAILANCSTHPHSPGESETRPLSDITTPTF